MEVSGEVRSTSRVTLGFGQGWPSSRPPHPRLWMKERICSPALLCVSRKKGQWGMRSCDELKTVITHHFGFSKHELLAYRSVPDPFVIIFSDRRARDLVFAAGRLIDAPPWSYLFVLGTWMISGRGLFYLITFGQHRGHTPPCLELRAS
jgi:hypothetical protein